MMFSLFSKIIKKLATYPKIILTVFLAVGILSIYPIMHLRWDLQLQDTITSAREPSNVQKIEDEFGGLGSLIVILQSKDSSANYRIAKDLAQKMQQSPAVHFADFETDIEFYKKNKFLYASESDIDIMVHRIEQLKHDYIMKNNPLFIDLKSAIDSITQTTSEQREQLLSDLEKKYFDKLAVSHSNKTGTIRIVEIYPTHSISDLQANRNLFYEVTEQLKKEKMPSDFQVHYAGKVYESIQTGKRLLPEAKMVGCVTAGLIILLLILNFFRQPQLIFISALPIATPIFTTMACSYMFYGRINLFTLLLAIVLPGQALQIINHVLNRYFLEREQNLSPQLCIESALLGIGPSTAASSFTFATLFASLIFIPLPGLQELGVLGSTGCVLNWAMTLLFSTALLQVTQRKKPFSIRHAQIHHECKISMLSNRLNWVIFSIIIVASLIGLYIGGTRLHIRNDFSTTEINYKDATIDSLIAETGFMNKTPIIVMLPDKAESETLLEEFNKLKENGNLSTVNSIFTLAQFSPNLQQKKMDKLRQLHSLVTKEFREALSKSELENFEKVEQALEFDENDEFEPPEYIAKKFRDKQGKQGRFAFIFTNIPEHFGSECTKLFSELHQIEGIDNGKYLVAGTPITRAIFLDRIMNHISRPIQAGSILVFLFMLVYYNRFSRALFTALPSVFATSWFLAALNFFDVKISAYSALTFPILIGASIDGSLQFFTAYYEKQKGTALTILRDKFFTIFLSQMAAFIGTYGMLISSHPGLRSMGYVSMIGLICIFIAQFTIFPLIAGSLDQYRLRQKRKKEAKK
ncbi:MMPL family transporter [Fibrobacter sp. UBA4297]|uniref:efflux RND transporter permease subunit n=1 Tax=Fibrobacter sp. UBA4297 TaxID=1946536 RepID=UPI0025C1FE7C|nr:MMPL family transporter [Fibrobacter sp. UBA4297]